MRFFLVLCISFLLPLSSAMAERSSVEGETVDIFCSGGCNPDCGWFIRNSPTDPENEWIKKGHKITDYQFKRWKKNNNLICQGECDGSGDCTESSGKGFVVDEETGEVVPTTWHYCTCIE